MYSMGMPLSVLVFAKPDRLSDALLSLLSGMQMIKHIDRIEDEEKAIASITDQKHDLVMLDMNSDEDKLNILIPCIKLANPKAYCLSVVDTVKLARVSQRNGANHVLLRGFSGNELLDVIMKAQKHQQNPISPQEVEPSLPYLSRT